MAAEGRCIGAAPRARRPTFDAGMAPLSGRAWQNPHVYISAKVDYAVRAMCTLAAADDRPVTAEALAASQGLPAKFLESILNDLRRAGLLRSQRGAEGGYRLSRPANAITVAEIIRPLDGPLAEVRGLRPEAANYSGAAEHLQTVWVAVRASLRSVLEAVTLADIVANKLPKSIVKLTADPDAWVPH
jgi:Rrf2 family protein